MPENEWLVTSEQLSTLERLLLERIRNASRDGSLSETPTFSHILNYWLENATQEEVVSWVSRLRMMTKSC